MWGVLVVAAISGLWWMVDVTERLSGDTFLQAIKPEVFGVVWNGTFFGLVWKWRLACWVGAMVAVQVGGMMGLREWFREVLGWVGLVFCGGLAGGLAWVGHGLIGPGWHRVADVVHLLAGGCWPMGLLPLMLMLWVTRGMAGRGEGWTGGRIGGGWRGDFRI